MGRLERAALAIVLASAGCEAVATQAGTAIDATLGGPQGASSSAPQSCSWVSALPADPPESPPATPLPEGAIAQLGTGCFLEFGAVTAVAFSPDGGVLATAHVRGGFDPAVLRLWSLSDGRCVVGFSGTSSATALAFAPSGALLAIGHEDGTTELLEPTTGATVGELRGDPLGVRAVAFSPDGRTLAIARGARVELWDAATRRERARTANEHEGRVNAVEFSPRGDLLASGSDDRSVRLWNPATGAELGRMTEHGNGVTGVAFSPDGTSLAAQVRGDSCSLWDVTTGQLTLVFNLGGGTCVAFAPTGDAIAIGCGSLVRLLAADGRPDGSRRFDGGHHGTVSSVAFSSDGSLLASGSADGRIFIWATGLAHAAR
jgi:WD40 repeat protein